VRLAAIGEHKPSLYMSQLAPVDLQVRPPTGVSLGMHVPGASMPHPDPHDPKTVAAGVLKRFAAQPPKADPKLLAELGVFVDRWLEDNVVPLSPDVDLSVSKWLSETHYPRWRSQELEAVWEEHGAAMLAGDQQFWAVAGHQKDECYDEPKHSRGINARHDVFKCAVGPFFKLVEKSLYQHPAFIKHVPVADRPRYIRDMLERNGAKYGASDYTSFEALFIAELMREVEIRLYKYMARHLPNREQLEFWFDNVLAGTNDITYRCFWVLLEAVRMSGEMCTSLGNGFSNLMFMLFMCKKKGCTDVAGVVEGDDGLFTANGLLPTGEDFERLGLIIKLETHTTLEHASFCGLVFDSEDLINVVDPREPLVSVGWGSRMYARSNKSVRSALLRCKGMSLVHQYAGCPIVQELGLYIVRVTEHIRPCKVLRVVNTRGISQWDREQHLAAFDAWKLASPAVAVPMRTRLLVENLYGINVRHQLEIESWLASRQELSPLDHPLIQLYMKTAWCEYDDVYVLEQCTNTPSLGVGTIEGFKDEVAEVLAEMAARGKPPPRPRKAKPG